MATYSFGERTNKKPRNTVVDLILSNPSSEAITFDVQSRNGTATGMNIITYTSFLTWCNTQEEVLIMILDHTLSHFLLEISVFNYSFQ